VYETEKQRRANSPINRRQSVVFPAPEGDETTNSRPLPLAPALVAAIARGPRLGGVLLMVSSQSLRHGLGLDR